MVDSLPTVHLFIGPKLSEQTLCTEYFIINILSIISSGTKEELRTRGRISVFLEVLCQV